MQSEQPGRAVWCVEDDESIRDVELYALRSAGFEVRGFEDGLAFWEALSRAAASPSSSPASSETPDLVVLDVMLPGLDGVQALSRMKATPSLAGIPVVMATAKGSEHDKIRGLDCGADYYLAKPFGVMELVACVKAVLRRCAPRQSENVLTADGLVVNLDDRTVTADGERVALTYKEFELLRLFMSHPGRAYTRDRLFSEVWGMDYVGETRTVDMHVKTLRQKLGSYGEMVETVRNVGYRFDASRHDPSRADGSHADGSRKVR